MSKPEQLAREEFEAFVTNPGLGELASLFGLAELPKDTHEKLASLEELAATHWDFRNGVERQAVNWNDELLDQEGSEQWKIIFKAAGKLGLVDGSEPMNKRPRTLAILGGANKSPLDRLRYGISVIDDLDLLVYLGSSRQIDTDLEREKIADYAEGAKTEFDLGSRALEGFLAAEQIYETYATYDDDTWGVRQYDIELNGSKKPAFALSTPRTIGARRATTYDNFRTFADSATGLADYSLDNLASVVSVTNAFYTAGQHLPGVQELTLPHGTQLETVGFSADYVGMTRKPRQLLQETKSAIDAAVRLEAALAA